MGQLTIADAKQKLELSKPSLAEMNFNKVSLAREITFAIQAMEANPYLLKTEGIEKVLTNIVLSGLSLNPVLKYAYLVPRKIKTVMTCCVDPSYMGLCKILTDTGSVVGISATIVYEKEVFSLDIKQGMGGYAKHKAYMGFEKPGKPIACYSIAILPNGMQHVELLRPWEWESIKARSESVKTYNTKKGAGEYAAIPTWITDEEEMIRKTCLKKHYKYLPKTEQAVVAATAIDLDNQANGIDFDSENGNQAPAAAAPEGDVKTPYALATEEDRELLISLINNPLLGDKVFVGKRDKLQTRDYINAEYDGGKLAKDLAEKMIKWLNNDIAIAKEAAGDPSEGYAEETAPPVPAAEPAVATEPSTQKDKDFE